MTCPIPFPLSLLLLTCCVYAQNTHIPLSPKSDSSAITANKNAPDVIKNTNDELILDDNDKSILPVENKKVSVQPSEPSAKVAADTVSKNSIPIKTNVSSVTAAATTSAVGQNPNPPAAAKNVLKDTVKKVTDEELILEGGEENLLGKEKTVQTKTVTSGQVSTAIQEPVNAADGRRDRGTASLPTPKGFADSAAKLLQQEPSAAVASATQTEISQPAATIIDGHSINFAKNLKEYRSPKLAMLMSLILPGAGQVYAKSNLWAVAFGVIEVGIISTGVALSAKSKNVKKQAHSYADQHYNPDRFKEYLDSLKLYLSIKGPKGDTIYRSIFSDGSDTMFFTEAQKKSDSYYGDAYIDGGTSSPFIRGWNDVDPDFTSGGFQIQPSSPYGIVSGDTSYLLFRKPDSTNRLFGVSGYQEHYDAMLKDSRRWANFSQNAFLSLLFNHLASAVMAGISAKRHNDELLGRESFWRHIEVEQHYVNTGSGTAPGYALQVEF